MRADASTIRQQESLRVGATRAPRTRRGPAFRRKPLSHQVMKREQIIRMFAGTVILASLALAHYYSLNWLWLTAFVGLNLFQSAVTRFCPLEIALRKLGVGTDGNS